MSHPQTDDHGLARRLQLSDAIVIGFGAMIGAGIFAAPGPAAAAAGSLLLIGLAAAGAVAYANATASARLAATYPQSGGTYLYARERLGSYWGFLSGWSFVIGKTASLAAMALTFGFYAYPEGARPIGIAAVAALTAVNYRGIQKTAFATRLLVAAVLAVLAVVIVASLTGGTSSIDRLSAGSPQGVYGVLQSAGLLFFAFAGYARIATLGEEVVDPKRTIPRAIPLALGGVILVYALVLVTVLAAIGPDVLARSPAPLAAALEAGRWSHLAFVVRLGATLAAAGVLLSLLAGISRTTFSMARRGDLPRFLGAVHHSFRTPHHAELVTGLVVIAIVTVADLRGAIGFSSFAVLGYYALTNASAYTLPPDRRLARSLPVLGMAGCLILAFTLPLVSVAGGLGLIATGSILWIVKSRSARR